MVGDAPWTIYWAAGIATVSSAANECATEQEAFEQFLLALPQHLNMTNGTLALMSSAGGIYAGSADLTISATTVPIPETPYGTLKLAMEESAFLSADLGSTVISFRITNLYGPRKNRTKAQGLVHHTVRAALTREPLTVFVPLGTLRDYVYVHDVAGTVRRRVSSTEHGSGIELVASGVTTSVAQLIAEVQRITHRRVPYSVSKERRGQPGNLIFAPSLEARSTSLACGIKRTADALSRLPH
jgi:UDP-glucose 4-epimerase